MDIVIGNLCWLRYVLTQSTLESPLQRILHFPLPVGPIPGFQNLHITATGYEQGALDYVKKLIRCCGATFKVEGGNQGIDYIVASIAR